MMRPGCLVILIGLMVPSFLFAQDPMREMPRSLSRMESGQVYDQPALQPQRLPGVDVQQLEAEDLRHPGTRFAAPVAVDLGIANAGTWTLLPDGGRLWQLKLEAPGSALGLVAIYDEFYMPPGAKLYMFSPDGKFIDGPYSEAQNNVSRHFVTGVVPGNTAIIEYYEPAHVRGQGHLHISRVDQAYHRENLLALGLGTTNVLGEELGFGSSGNCHPNVSCAEGEAFKNEKRAVCRVILVLEEGTGYCTGALINNTEQDGRPLLVSAFHCQDGYTPLYDFWRFDFNYESKDCVSPSSEPLLNSIIGCTQLAGYQKTDFLLLELSRKLPGAFNAYFLGWNRADESPASGSIIHHPRGDIKKIGLDENPLPIFREAIQWNNEVTTPEGYHLRAKYDIGSFDIGSSGAPLLNQDQRYVGQLHGGSTSCTGAVAYFGRLNVSWEGGGTPSSRLKDWLDPIGLGIMSLDGMENPLNAGGVVAGVVTTETGAGIQGAVVQLKSSSGFSAELITDDNGKFSFSPMPFGTTFEVEVSKPGNPLNGISVFDLVQIQRHILSIELLKSPYHWVAADVNKSRTISTADLIQIRKVLLGLEAEFKNISSWIFLPADFEFPGGQDPLIGEIPSRLVIPGFQADILDLDFIGIKAGDINASANPNN